MGPVYVDTSALVKFYYPEKDSDRIDALLLRSERVFVSRLAVVEFAAALGKKVRMGELKPGEETILWEAFQDDIQGAAMELVDLDERHFTKAAGYIRQFGGRCRIKTLDALHLAQAHDLRDCSLLCTDETMLRVAGRLGIRKARY